MSVYGITIPSLAVLAIGCAGTPGARPYDMSVARHEAAAQATAGQGTDDSRRQAADHRAAAAALLDAEARACVGLTAGDRDLSPLELGEISGVRPIVERTGGKVPVTLTTGAVVTLRAAPGVTAEWLQRVVDCHVAHMTTLDVEEMPSCPLVLRGAVARVSSTGNGFAITIRSGSSATAHDILARARRLGAEQASRR